MKNTWPQTFLNKTCSVAIVTLLCCGLGLAFQQTAEWSKLDSVEGRFSVSMPSKPEPASRDVDTAVGKLALYTFGSSNNVAQVMISYADYPNEPSDAAQYEKVLDGVRDGVLKGLAADLISETRIILKSHPGRELRAKKMFGDVEIVFTWKMYLVGRRLYQMGAATTKADAEVPDVQRFFDSFYLMEQERDLRVSDGEFHRRIADCRLPSLKSHSLSRHIGIPTSLRSLPLPVVVSDSAKLDGMRSALSFY